MEENKRALFERLLAEHGDKIYAFAFTLSRNEADAADLTAEAYRKALRSFNRFDVSRPFESWLFRIVQNVHRDAMRRRKTRRTDSLDEVSRDEDGRPLREPVSNDPAPDAGMEESETRAVLEKAILEIPEKFREPLLMFDMMQMPYGKIAETLVVPVNTIRTRIFRGRKILREKLRPYYEAGGVL